MSDICPHGDIAAACMECLDGPPAHVSPNRTKPVASSPPFAARYAGLCPECHEWWDEGHDIVRTNDGGYACADCARPMP